MVVLAALVVSAAAVAAAAAAPVAHRLRSGVAAVPRFGGTAC
jgi:hypothetical protein